jgi:hypothetical protein
MAGLLAARVLSESFRQVTVIERDVLPAEAGQRRSVPQGRHVHALLSRGAQVLDDLFRGLTKQVAEAGAPVGDLLDNVRWFLSGHRLAQADIGQPLLLASRPMLEAHVRSLVKGLGGVSFLEGHDIAGPTASGDKRRVTGVRVRSGGAAEDAVDADLVVDATGRGSRAPAWLAELGYGRPVAEKVTVGVGYASRSYRLPPGALGKDRLMLHAWTPDYPRAAALAEQEGDRFLLTVAGILGDHPPTDPKGFDEFTTSLRFPDVHEAIRDGVPLDDPVAFRYPANVRLRYERMRDGKFGIWLRGGYTLGHLKYSCHYESPTLRCRACSAGSPCSPAPTGPATRGAGAAGSGAAMTSRSSTCRLAGMPRIAASRDPARPASATATSCSMRPSGGAFRPQGTVRPSTCSANVRRLQLPAAQKNRRTFSRITTRRPPIAASASRLP